MFQLFKGFKGILKLVVWNGKMVVSHQMSV